MHWMGQGGLFGPQYYDAMYIDTTGENMATPPELGSIFGGTSDTWAGYPIANEVGDVDTGTWLDWVNVTHAPWILSYSLNQWMYIEEASVTDSGSWVYISNY